MKPVVNLVLAVGISFSFFGFGCSEAERTYDCAQICEKYEECVDDELDNTDCIDSCEDQGDNDADFADMASDCEDCLDDTSCTEAAAKCTTTCAEVIASST